MKTFTIIQLPPLLTVKQVNEYFHIGTINAYDLASAGEIQTATLGSPKNPGTRVFTTQSLIDYMNRRIALSPKLNPISRKPKKVKEASGPEI